MDLLEVSGIGKKYNGFLLDDISFTVPAGYILGYVGRNGAGKTTTLEMITHQRKADTGSIKINGVEYKENPENYKEMIGYIRDICYFPDEFNLMDIKKILKDFYTTFDENKFMNYVQKWQLPEKKKVKDYSKGMQVRLMFAGVLARDTKLLILDEATNGLDPVVKQEVLELIQEYIQEGDRSVIFSTHILNDLEQIADYIFFLHDGKKVMYDIKEEILERYVLVKGGLEDLNEYMEKNLIGIKKTSVGFEGILESDKGIHISKNCVVEKPSIDQIVVSYIKQKEAQR